MRRVIVGTAGHVDHGKTRLIEALTGIDCDRWAEEKERGITIDLGFAHLEEDDLQIGFIDVPGHERFVHNALAGMGGIRLVLLVVAADEGIEPQTEEHLEICSLLEIPRAVVALTKTDLVDDELSQLALLEIEEALAETRFAGSPIVPVSSTTGDGVLTLRETLVAEAGRGALDDPGAGAARLPLDRAFQLKGLGTVVTGTLVSGAIEVGDTLEVVPSGGMVRVRSIEVHGDPRDRALPGERTSLQASGTDLEELPRGVQLIAPGSLEATHSLLASVSLLGASDPLEGWTPVRVHLLSADVLGRMRALDPLAILPGGEGIVEIRLEGPLAAVRDDRVILRRPSPVTTVGGGRILDPRWHRRPPADRAKAIERLRAGDESALLLWVAEGRIGGVTTRALARRLGGSPEAVALELRRLAADGKIVAAGTDGDGDDRWISAGALRRVAERAETILRRHFAENRLAEGMPKAEAAKRILGDRGKAVAGIVLDWLEARGIVEVRGSTLTLPGREVELSEREGRLATGIVDRYEEAGLTPPPPREVARELGAKPEIVSGLVDHLVDTGRLVRLPDGLLVGRGSIDRLTEELQAEGWESFSVADFKERFGLSRKWAIPLLEHLDSIGVTRRIGDARQIVTR